LTHGRRSPFMRYFLGIDIGTSGVKAALVDERGRVKRATTAAHPLFTPRPGWAEQKPQDWWKSTISALKKLLPSTGVQASQIASVGLSGQMHSSVFLDRANKVIRPALLWCDGRTTEECREITRRVGEERLSEWVGNPAFEGFTLSKVLWLKKHEPAAFARLEKVVLAKDYIRYRLTGALASEPSDASATLMYDTARHRWSEAIMEALELDSHILPDLGGSTEILGTVTRAAARTTGLLEGTPVVGGGADNACGAVGVGLVSSKEAVASWGTSGTVLTPTPRPVVDPGLRVHTFCHVVPDTWYLMGVVLTAGGAFGWHARELARELSPKSNVELLLNREAGRVRPGADGLTFLPYLQGERTPHRDASARAAFVGLSLAHTRAHMSRAVTEGICFALRDCFAVLQTLSSAIERVLVTGAGAKSAFIRKMQADVYGMPVVRVHPEEGPAYGAALLAAVGVGAFPDVATACKRTLKRLSPEASDPEMHRIYEEPYSRFQRLYPALRSLHTESVTKSSNHKSS
jgi:xylulokinase